jgi:hypothetical protein
MPFNISIELKCDHCDDELFRGASFSGPSLQDAKFMASLFGWRIGSKRCACPNCSGISLRPNVQEKYDRLREAKKLESEGVEVFSIHNNSMHLQSCDNELCLSVSQLNTKPPSLPLNV